MQTAFTIKNILFALSGIVVIGGGVLVFTGRAGTQEGAPVTPVISEQNATPSSLKELLASTATTKCTVSSTNDINNISGTVYVAGGKMRGDFITTLKSEVAVGKVIQSHMIVDADMSYMWGDEMKTGIKISRAQAFASDAPKTDAPTSKGAIDINEKSDYKCGGWNADDVIFTPPTEISFTDMSAMMVNIPTSVKVPVTGAGTAPKIPAGGEGGVSSQQIQAMCGACDQAGTERDQCRQALGCK